jgi:hypothetical protein
MLKISKNLSVEPNETVLILSYPNRPITVCIKKTDCNPEYYFGYRVMVTNNYWADWPIKYDNGTIAYNIYGIPKYAKKLVEKAFRILEQSFNG